MKKGRGHHPIIWHTVYFLTIFNRYIVVFHLTTNACALYSKDIAFHVNGVVKFERWFNISTIIEFE